LYSSPSTVIKLPPHKPQSTHSQRFRETVVGLPHHPAGTSYKRARATAPHLSLPRVCTYHVHVTRSSRALLSRRGPPRGQAGRTRTPMIISNPSPSPAPCGQASSHGNDASTHDSIRGVANCPGNAGAPLCTHAKCYLDLYAPAPATARQAARAMLSVSCGVLVPHPRIPALRFVPVNSSLSSSRRMGCW